MSKSKLFWGGLLFCGVVILLSILIHNTNQPQETITIYKTVTPERSVKPQSSNKPMAQTRDNGDETEIVSTLVDSDASTDAEEFSSEDTQFTDAEMPPNATARIARQHGQNTENVGNERNGSRVSETDVRGVRNGDRRALRGS